MSEAAAVAANAELDGGRKVDDDDDEEDEADDDDCARPDPDPDAEGTKMAWRMLSSPQPKAPPV